MSNRINAANVSSAKIPVIEFNMMRRRHFVVLQYNPLPLHGGGNVSEAPQGPRQNSTNSPLWAGGQAEFSYSRITPISQFYAPLQSRMEGTDMA